MKFQLPSLRLERLEDRSLPANFGVPWAYPGDLTISFVPDGTPLAGGGMSNLFATMEATMSRAVWQGEILRAFQSWAANANVNVRIVADSGDPLGAPGAVQGDARFGDVRIAATKLSPDAVASGAPFSWTGTTLAGDMFFNNTMQFSLGGGTDLYDLYTIALQESGHVLGLGNSPDTNSVMYTVYVGPRTGLSAGDITDLQQLYGARTAEFATLSGTGGADNIVPVSDIHTNDLMKDATMLKARDQSDARFDTVYNGKITDWTDVDYYKIQVPKGIKDVNLVLMVWGLERGGLNPAVHLYDSAGKPLAYQVLANDDGVIAVQAVKLIQGGLVYVRVEARDPGILAHTTGGYQILADFGDKPMVVFNEVATGTLSSATAIESASLTVHRGALMEFSLAARTGDGTGANVAMTITDAAGNVVLILTAKSGRTNVTRTVYMSAGDYTVTYSAAGPGLVGGVTYNLKSLILSDNIGPYSTTTSEDGGSGGGTGGGDTGYTYDGVTTTTWSDQFWF